MDNGKTTFTKVSDNQVLMERVFNAPRDALFRAYTDPNQIPMWWGPRNMTTTVEKMDFRPGGMWRYVQHDGDGREAGFHGVYQEILTSGCMASSFEYEDMPGHTQMVSAIFEEIDATHTKLTSRTTFQTIEDRDAALESGMEAGAGDSLDRLAALVEK